MVRPRVRLASWVMSIGGTPSGRFCPASVMSTITARLPLKPLPCKLPALSSRRSRRRGEYMYRMEPGCSSCGIAATLPVPCWSSTRSRLVLVERGLYGDSIVMASFPISCCWEKPLAAVCPWRLYCRPGTYVAAHGRSGIGAYHHVRWASLVLRGGSRSDARIAGVRLDRTGGGKRSIIPPVARSPGNQGRAQLRVVDRRGVRQF